MEKFGVIVQQLPEYLSATVGVMVALIALFSLIPGEQPEKFLHAVVDFLSKFSVKKK